MKKQREAVTFFFNCDPSPAKLEGAGESWRELEGEHHFTSHSMLRSLWSAQSHLGNKGQCYLAMARSRL